MSNGKNTPSEGITKIESLTTASDSLRMTAKSSGTSLTTGHNSVSKIGAGPRLSIGTNPLLTSVSRQGTIQGGPAISYNSQQEFHGFCSQIFVAPTSLPHYLLNSLTKSANDPNTHFMQPNDRAGLGIALTTLK